MEILEYMDWADSVFIEGSVRNDTLPSDAVSFKTFVTEVVKRQVKKDLISTLIFTYKQASECDSELFSHVLNLISMFTLQVIVQNISF